MTDLARVTTGAPITGRARTKLPRALLALLLVALLAGGGAWGYLRYFAPAPVGAVLLYGNVDIREVQPAFNASGRVTAMLVQEGDVVKAGQLLATMDDVTYAAALEQADHQAAALGQTLARLQAGSRPEEIAAAKATMDALGATLANTRVTYARLLGLAPKGAATLQQRDDAKATQDMTEQQYQAARQTYILAVEGPRVEDIQAADASHRAAQAAVVLARKNLAETKVYAPADGIIENRILEPGDMAAPNVPVYTMALLSPLWVRAYVAEPDMGKVALGMRAEVTTDSFAGRVYHGWIGYISPTSEFTPKTVETTDLRTALVYQVRVYVCDARNELRLGMPASVRIDLSQRPPFGGAAATPGCDAAIR